MTMLLIIVGVVGVVLGAWWFLFKSHGGLQVYHLGHNIYRYMEADDACKKLGARLATLDDMKNAAEQGANWNNLGWSEGENAHYPSGGKLVGGKMPPQLKLGANCYGVRPPKDSFKELLMLPWNGWKWSY